MKQSIRLLVLLALAGPSCGVKRPEVAAREAVPAQPSSRSPAAAGGRPAAVLDTNTLARERLVLVEREMLRVSYRLEREGTPDQRARWHDELSAIEHDCSELSTWWQRAELMSPSDRAAEHARLVQMIDVLYAINAQTAAQIERSLDAASAPAAAPAK